MKHLLYKEFKLGWPPALFIFLLFGALLLIPSWPFFIAFGYLFIAINSKFFLDRDNRDIMFTGLMPVRKENLVPAKIVFIAVLELLQVIFAIPFAILRDRMFPMGNMVGMNTNFAFFGFVLILYAVFNLIFFPNFFKTAYKIGGPIVLAISASTVFAVFVEVAIAAVPVLRERLNGMGTDGIAYQLPVLIAGIVLFAGLTALSCILSMRNFKKVEL